MREIVSPISGFRSPFGQLVSPLAFYAVGIFRPEFVSDFYRQKYFTNSQRSTFADAITHTRASTATYVDSTGTLQTAAINEPRVGHHVWNGSAWVNEGLLHESEARTNLLVRSEVVDDAGWTDNGSTSTNLTDGALGVWDGVSIASGGQAFHRLNADNFSVTSGDTLTFRAWVKEGTSGRLRINLQDVSGGSSSTIQGSFGSLAANQDNIGEITSVKEEDFGNGIVAVSGTITVNFTGDLRFGIGPDSAVSGETVIAYAAQLEAGPTPSSYIPTSGSTVTRAADVLTIPAANLPWPAPEYIGPELVTNGTFDTDISGWTDNSAAGGSIAWNAAGYLDLTNTSGVARADTSMTVEIGKVYEVIIERIDAGSGGFAYLGGVLGSGAYVNGVALTQGVNKIYVVPTSTTTLWLRISLFSAITASFDNISVREINPLAVSIQMDGRVTYADLNSNNQAELWRWGGLEYLHLRIQSSTTPDRYLAVNNTTAGGFIGDAFGVDGDLVEGVLHPVNAAVRFTSTRVRGASNGVADGIGGTATRLPDLSATNLTLGTTYNGTIRTFRIWAQDIGDAGLVEATEPSLVPSLSLTFDGTENSFIVEDWS